MTGHIQWLKKQYDYQQIRVEPNRTMAVAQKEIQRIDAQIKLLQVEKESHQVAFEKSKVKIQVDGLKHMDFVARQRSGSQRIQKPIAIAFLQAIERPGRTPVTVFLPDPCASPPFAVFLYGEVPQLQTI